MNTYEKPRGEGASLLVRTGSIPDRLDREHPWHSSDLTALCQAARDRARDRLRNLQAVACTGYAHHSTTASASTSTNISAEIKLLTCTMLVAGRIDPKNSPCARPTFSHSAMFVT